MSEEKDVSIVEIIISRDEKHEWLNAFMKVKARELEDMFGVVFEELLGGIPGLPGGDKKLKTIKIHPDELIAVAAQFPLPVLEKVVKDLNMFLQKRSRPKP